MLTYIARDKAGNTSTKSCNFIFIPQKVSDEMLRRLGMKFMRKFLRTV